MSIGPGRKNLRFSSLSKFSTLETPFVPNRYGILGAKILGNAAKDVQEKVKDGSATAAILTSEMIAEGTRLN